MLEELPPELVEAWDLGTLFATSVDGVLVWIVRRFGDWYVGPALGPVFAESVLATWQQYFPGPPANWIA